MKARLIIRIMVLLLLTYGVGDGVARFLEVRIEEHLNQELRMDYLQRNGLPLTRQHLELSKGMTESYTPSTPMGPAPDAFFPGLPADRFPKDRPIRLSVYFSKAVRARMALDLEPLQQRAAARGVAFQWMETAEELRQALLEDDIVFWAGHSNYGEGMLFEKEAWVVEGAHRFVPEKGSEPFPSEIARKPFPECQAALFMMWGCRSDTYYGEALASHMPGTALMTTNVSFAPSTQFPASLELLIHTLSVRASLVDWMKELELLYRGEHLRGRVSELRIYGEMPKPEAPLFRIRSPRKDLPEG